MRPLTIAAAGAILCISASAQRPTADEQQRALAAARDQAVHYASKLPDFLCTEQVERAASTSAANTQVDRLTILLSFNGHKENYKLVSMNGSPTKQSFQSLDGLISRGEFGSQLIGVFEPASAADFQWKESSTLRKRRVAVYTYRIKRANSHYMVGDRNDDGKLMSGPAGYHGEVFLDSETRAVLRLTSVADDIPKEFNVLSSTVEVDYDFVTVAGKSYLLPSHSQSGMEHGFRKISNTVTFTGYRKFEADSTVDFKE